MMQYNSTKKIEEIIEGATATAKQERWPMVYDQLADAFYWTKPEISHDAKLVQFSRETAFYITPSGETQGIFIQPFRNNFLTENIDMVPIVNLFKKDAEKPESDMLTLSKKEQEEMNPLILGFSESIKKDIYRDILEAGSSMADLQGTLDVALGR